MLYIPGLGYIPLANFPGLGGAAAGGRGGPAGPPPQPEGEREWEGLGEMPAATQEGLFNALSALKEEGRTELTVLVLGKGGVGKSRFVGVMLCGRGSGAAHEAAAGRAAAAMPPSPHPAHPPAITAAAQSTRC